MNKAKQLALGQIFNLPADHTAIKDLLADPDAVALSQTVAITREDFISAEADGKSFFAFAEVWEHMDDAVAYLREKGADIKGADFNTTVAEGKTAVNLADDLDVLRSLFTPVIWKGQYQAMLNTWYGLGHANTKKDKVDFIAVQENGYSFDRNPVSRHVGRIRKGQGEAGKAWRSFPQGRRFYIRQLGRPYDGRQFRLETFQQAVGRTG
jgi:hypothetical protein